MPIIILFSIIIGACLAWYIRKRIIAAKHERLFNTPLPNQWITLLEDNVSLYSRLPGELKIHLHGCIQLFLNEKEFIGRGLDITEQMRLTIAGNACMLLLQGHKRHFPGFSSILVYPDTYVAKQVNHHGSHETIEDSHRAGESWFRGPIVLSWGDSLRGSLNANDGHNVVIHEFAHKLDEQSGRMDGLPTLRKNVHYSEWASVLSEEFDALKYRAQRGKNSVMDEYGTVSPPEFFAVATESFFEKPKQMKKKLPDLYKQLSRFYSIDPAEW
ncbi:MAG: zinc-dependent peptidase [Gammaproteobacteria bacterium]|nr:zinc-dependent peptidase [Gammaproteobacteria bacterium]